MSGKRRRSETSWGDMKHAKMPNDDDISRDRDRHRMHTDDRYGLPYRGRDRRSDSSAHMNRDRDRSRSRDWENSSPFYEDRHKSNEYGNHIRHNSRSTSRGDNLKESWSHKPDHSRYGDDRNSRNQYDDNYRHQDERRQPNRTSKIPCKYFSAGNCTRGDCKFSHDVPDSRHSDRRSRDNTGAHKNMTWHEEQPRGDTKTSDWSEKNKSWDGPSWDDVESGRDNVRGPTSDDKKTWDGPSWDDVSNPNLDNKNRSWDDDDVSAPGFSNKSGNGTSRGTGGSYGTKSGNNLDEKTMSWNGRLWDDGEKSSVRDETLTDNKMRKWDELGFNEKGCEKNDDFLPQQHNTVNDSHLNISEEPNQQILTSGKDSSEIGVMENEIKKSPKKNQELAENTEQKQENIDNPEKVQEGTLGNDEKSMGQFRDRDRNRSPNRSRSRDWESRSPFHDDRHKSNEYVKNNQDGRRRTSKIQCRFFSAGKCKRDDCKFSHDVPDYDRKSHDNSRAHDMTWQDRHPHADSNASDLSEKNKSWNGPTWDGVESRGFDVNKRRKWESHDSSDDRKKSSRDDASKSNPNLDNKNRSWNGPSWDEVDASGGSHGAKSGNDINENTKWEKGSEKNDYFLPQQHNVVNGNTNSEFTNQQILTTGKDEKGQVPQQNLTNAIDYLQSLPNSAHNQATKPKEGKIGNDVMEKTPKKQEPIGNLKGNENRVAENVKRELEKVNTEKMEEGNIGNDEKLMRPFRSALLEFVKEILKPKWKEGRMTREVYKTVVKKVVEKVTTSIQGTHIPTTEAKIEQYLARSKSKIMKLVEAYIDKLVKA